MVRYRVGYTAARADVLTRSPVTDQVAFLAVRDLPDEPIPARRIWLRGRDTGRFASLLLFAPNGIFGLCRDAALALPGTQVHADLHFYPGQPPLRALVGTRRAAPQQHGPHPAGDAAALLATWAAALAQDPWLSPPGPPWSPARSR